MPSLIFPNIPRIITALAEWSSFLYIALLLFKPQLNFKNGTIIVLSGVGQVLLQVWAGTFPIEGWLFGMLINFSWMLLCTWQLSLKNIATTTYLTCKAFILAEFLASLLWQICCYWDLYLKLNRNLWVKTIFCAVGFLLYYLLDYKLANKTKVKTLAKNLTRSDALHAVLIAAMIFAASNIGFVLKNTYFSLGNNPTIYMMRTFIDLCGIMVFSLIENQRYELTLKNDLIQINNMFNSQYEQYQAYKESSETVNRRFHDLKHQLDIIALESSDKRRQEYIDSLRNDIKQFKADVKTGNPIIDVILTRKNAYCINKNINFTVIANGKLLNHIETMDLCSLIGNSLDNAIEACEQVKDPERRIIKLKIFDQANFIIYQLENYTENTNKFDDGLPQTTKKDRRNPHGYGLKSISYVTKKYNGTLRVQEKDNWFTLAIIFPKN
ncbi:sensor histidine kinase [Lactobacillus psittaci]|uniref:Sensor histidine kinase NatK-like C-terminal domain-containing protein n=1 Tax=Lactobacillus psittaci DSM 15354 TaxID=1122152 RepID=A0A0R1S3K5_9LACO|nr:sensor histidine kinase [Lactobacillus psittaci]KRL63118.1 hypothetical protein FC23_GL001057 [Lactobacillus psittaci DSM 15354]